MMFSLQCIDAWICVAQSFGLYCLLMSVSVFSYLFSVSAADGKLFHTFHFDTSHLGLGVAACGSSP